MPTADSSTTTSFEDLRSYLFKVLASETPVRLVKSGKLDGLFSSRSGRNAELINAATAATPQLLELVGQSGKPDPKPLFVRLTDAGLDALAAQLPTTHLDQALADAAAAYKTRFRESCLRATQARLRGLADRQRHLVAEHRRVIDAAQETINAQISALEEERRSLEQQATVAVSPVPHTRLEPCQDRDYEFIQHAAGLLVLEWRDSKHPQVRATLESILDSLSITKIGCVGESLRFDGRYHDALDDVTIEGMVTVAQPGWQLKTHRGTLVLLRAAVSAAAANTKES